jgi:hypothetical protein
MTHDDVTSVIGALEALKQNCPLQDVAGSAWLDGIDAAIGSLRKLDESLPALELEVSDEELREFPRMQAVRATILAGGGRATRSAILEGAAIVGAFVEYELRQAEEQRQRETAAGLGGLERDVLLRFGAETLPVGGSVVMTAYAAEWMKFVSLELEPEDGLEVSELMVGATPVERLSWLPDQKIQKGERVSFRVTNRLPQAVTVLAWLSGDAVPPEEQSKEG